MGFDNRRRGGGRKGDFDDFGGGGGDFGGGDRGRGRGRDRGGFGGGSDFGGGGGGFGAPPSGGFGAPPGGGYGGANAGGGFAGGAARRPFTPANNLGTAKGTVKFFNAQKGFGFVVREDGGEDVFVHISAVERAGLTALAEGQPMTFTLSERNGRISATDIVIDGEPMEVKDGGGGAPAGGPMGGPGGARGAPPRSAPSDERYDGTVKFFNAQKGFGFIAREDGGQDAFVHISAVERAGMSTLNEGQKLSFQLETDRRGKQAAVNLQGA